MVLTPSTTPELGTIASDFRLPDVVSGATVARDQVTGKHGLLVLFICAHCPYVQHVQEELARIGRDYAGRGIGILDRIRTGSDRTDAAIALHVLEVMTALQESARTGTRVEIETRPTPPPVVPFTGKEQWRAG